MNDLKVRLIIGISILGTSLAFATPVRAQDAVVKIYVERPGANPSQGTGFFSDDKGQVITAYHVVEGARQITVSHGELGVVTDVMVEYIAPDYDLAVLRVLHPIVKTPALPIDVESSQFGDLELTGYPRGGVLQRFRGRATSGGFVNSHTIRDSRGRRLFEQQIDVIPLDLSIYTGLSGGPVVGQRGVVGVLSGSYQEGGGIGWAIPSKYLQQMTEVNVPPQEIRWPRLTLMATAWRNLRASVLLNSEASQIFERFMDESTNMARITDGMLQSAYTTQLNFMLLRPFYQRLVDDPALRNDPQAARSLIEPVEQQAFGSFRKFLDFSGQFADDGRDLAVALSNTIIWMIQEGGVDDRQGQAIGREIREIRGDIADMTKGIDAYLGIDTGPLLTAMATLVREIQTAGDDFVAQARARMTFVDTWTPAMERYASADAIIFMSQFVSAMRRLGRLMEPIVYQVR